MPLLAVGARLLAMIGLLFVYFERDRPYSVLRQKLQQIAQGERERLIVTEWRGAYRKLADSINQAHRQDSRARGRDARRPRKKKANLDEILGPTPESNVEPYFGFADAPSQPQSRSSPPAPKPPRVHRSRKPKRRRRPSHRKRRRSRRQSRRSRNKTIGTPIARTQARQRSRAPRTGCAAKVRRPRRLHSTAAATTTRANAFDEPRTSARSTSSTWHAQRMRRVGRRPQLREVRDDAEQDPRSSALANIPPRACASGSTSKRAKPRSRQPSQTLSSPRLERIAPSVLHPALPCLTWMRQLSLSRSYCPRTTNPNRCR